MAFNGFPYTNFADLNLDWMLQKIKDALTLVNGANDNANNAVDLATEANNRTLTYAEQIAGAVEDAEEALGLAQDSQDILVIYPDNEGKPVNYKKYINGETEYIGTDEILTELTLYKRIPFFMDRNQNIFILNGFLDSGTSNTKARFVRAGGAITFFAIIDRNQTITYTSADEGSIFNVSFNFIPYDSGLDESNYWDSDNTFAEIRSAINSGKTVVLTVKYNGEIRAVMPCLSVIDSNTDVIYFGYSRGVTEVSPMNGYTNALAYFTINTSDVVTQQGLHYVPGSSTQLTGNVLTVNSAGKAEWLPAQGGSGSAVEEIVWGYQDEDSGNAVIRKRSDNSIYTASQMVTDANARKLILIQSVNGLYYLSGAGTILGQVSIASFFNGGTYTMTVDSNGVFTETPVSGGGGSAENAVLYTVQNLTTVEKTQARANIGASADIAVSSADNGKFMRVVNGAWAAVTVPDAENNSFGGT